MTENFNLKALIALSDVVSYNRAKSIKQWQTDRLTGRLTDRLADRLTLTNKGQTSNARLLKDQLCKMADNKQTNKQKSQINKRSPATSA